MTTPHTHKTKTRTTKPLTAHTKKVHYVANYLAQMDGVAPIGAFKDLPVEQRSEYLGDALNAVNATNSWEKNAAALGGIDPRLTGEATRAAPGDGGDARAPITGDPGSEDTALNDQVFLQMLMAAALSSAITHHEANPDDPFLQGSDGLGDPSTIDNPEDPAPRRAA